MGWLGRSKHRIAVRWACGTAEGFVGRGHDESSAHEDAFRRVMIEASRRGTGFKICSAGDVATWPDSHEKRVVIQDWERGEDD